MAIRVRVNNRAVRALMNDPKVKAELERRAARIAAAAGPGMEVDSQNYERRARASVRTATNAARRAEATGRALTRAIDAGRG